MEDDIIAIIREMAKINVAVKAWRPLVFESLNDNRSFNSTPDAAEKWMPIIKFFFDTDKTALPELLGMLLISVINEIPLMVYRQNHYGPVRQHLYEPGV